MATRSKRIVFDEDKIRLAFVKDMVEALTVLGYRAMAYAYGRRTFRHKSRNLHDSYASAVYVGGKLVEESIRYIGNPLSKKVDHNTKKTGRQTVDEYLHSHHFGEANNEVVVVVIAAMYYTKFLEGGDKNTSHLGPGESFIVISPAREYINKNYWSALYKVYDKYGLEGKPHARVIKGEQIPDKYR